MSILRRIGTGVAWSSVGTVISKVVGLGNVFLILSYLSVYEYGLTELVLSIVSITSIFLLPGLADAVIADMGVERARKSPERMKGIFVQYLQLSMVLGFIAWCALFFGAPFAASLSGNENIEYFIRIISFSFLIAPFRACIGVLTTVTLRYKGQFLFNPIEEIAKFSLLFVLLVFLHLGPAGLLYASTLAPLVTILVFSGTAFGAYREFGHVRAEYTHTLWNIAALHRKWSIATSYLGNLSAACRIWIIRALLGTEAVGLFSFAFGITSHLTGLMPLSSVLKSLVPAYIDRPKDLARLIKSSLKVQLLNASVFIAIGFATLPIFVLTLFPNYSASIPLLLLMIFMLLPSGAVSILTPVFAAFKEQKSFFWASVFKTFVSIVLLPLLIVFFGILGMAIELVLTLSISAAERYLRIRRLLPQLNLHAKDFVMADDQERQLIRAILNGLFSKHG